MTIRNNFCIYFRVSIIIAISVVLFSCKTSLGGYSKLKSAEEFMRHKKYDEAISAYKEHINSRLSQKDRPDWEDPYFYYLMIGDIELQRGQLEQALASYALAQEKGIHSSFISDRYRFAAGWLESQGKLEEARQILIKYRELDPLLFDAKLDRIAKEIVKKINDKQAEENPVEKNREKKQN
jgi:tetratricopeptide (TPR) repeat protein